MGVLKIERQDKLGCANTNEHNEHAGKVDGEGRICKAATSGLGKGHGAFADLWPNMRQCVEPHDKRDHANRQVDEEDTLPGKACHQHAAEHGATHHAVFTVLIMTFMVCLDSTVVTVALPVMHGGDTAGDELLIVHLAMRGVSRMQAASAGVGHVCGDLGEL